MNDPTDKEPCPECGEVHTDRDIHRAQAETKHALEDLIRVLFRHDPTAAVVALMALTLAFSKMTLEEKGPEKLEQYNKVAEELADGMIKRIKTLRKHVRLSWTFR